MAKNISTYPGYVTHLIEKSVFSENFKDWKVTLYRMIERFAINHPTASQYAFRHGLSNYLSRELGQNDNVYSLWVNNRGERHVTVTITIFEVGKLKFRVVVPHLRNPAEIKTKARYDIGCLIGDISQDFYECSYNDDDVFVAWKSKSLNNYWEKSMDANRREVTLRGNGMDRLFDEYAPGKKYDWELLFDNLFALSDGWPVDWLSNYVSLADLLECPRYNYTRS